MVDYGACSFGGKRDVELAEEGDERARHREGGGRGEEDVALGIDEVEENLGSQVGAKTCASSSACGSSRALEHHEPLTLVGRKRI